MAEMAGAAIRVVTALGAEELIIDATGRLPQWAGEGLRHADVGSASFTALAIFVAAALHADELVIDAARNAVLTDDGLRFADAGGA